MSFGVDKTSEELNKIKQSTENTTIEESVQNIAPLSDIEKENLNTGLSGEVITPGFTENEAENLTESLSGKSLAPEDSISLMQTLENSDEIIEKGLTEEKPQIQEQSLTNDTTKEISNEVDDLNYVESRNEKSILEQNLAEQINSQGTNIKEYFMKLELKDFRVAVGVLSNLEQLAIIRKLIENMPFSKPEKLMLLNECLKQQGIIQNSVNDTNNQENTDYDTKNSELLNDTDNEQLKSRVSFDLFSMCKTPSQRNFANFIINNQSLYLYDENSKFLFKNFFTQYKTDDDIKTLKSFLETLLNLKSYSGTKEYLDQIFVECIKTTNPKNINFRLQLLNEYLKNDKIIDKKSFGVFLLNCNDEYSCNEIIRLLHSPNNIEKETSDTTKSISSYYGELYQVLNAGLKNQNDHIQFIFSSLVAKILSSKNFNQDKQILKLLSNIVSKGTFDEKYLYFLLNSISLYEENENTTKQTTEEFCKNCEDTYENNSCVDLIKQFLTDTSEQKKGESDKNLIFSILAKDKKIYTEFTSGRAYTDENLQNLFQFAQVDYTKPLLHTLCKQNEFSASNIITIMENTPYYAINLTKKILNTKNLTAQQKADVITLIYVNRETTGIIEKMIDENNLDMSTLPKLLDSTKIGELKEQQNKKEPNQNHPEQLKENS